MRGGKQRNSFAPGKSWMTIRSRHHQWCYGSLTARFFLPFRFSGTGALLIDDACGNLFRAPAVTPGSLKFMFQFFVFPLAFGTAASWHNGVLSVDPVLFRSQRNCISK